MHKALKRVWAMVLCMLMAGAPGVSAASSAGVEYQVKTAMMYNFLKFIDWPEGDADLDDGALTVGVVGKNPFGKSLDDLGKRTVKGRAIEIKKFGKIRELQPVHVLFVSSSLSGSTPQVLESVRGKSTLTVGDSDDFIKRGGIIEFTVVKGSVKFRINSRAAREAKLKVNPKLEKLAVK